MRVSFNDVPVRRVFILFVVVAAASASLARAGVLMTQDKALALAFPTGKCEFHRVSLTAAEKASVENAARARLESASVTYYSGTLADGSPGAAFFETNIVRTMPETFMTVLDSSGTVRFVELLSFHEPGDYLPPKKWMEQFRGKPLSNRLLVKRDIRNVTGATLTTQAITSGVRRALAVWDFIRKREEK